MGRFFGIAFFVNVKLNIIYKLDFFLLYLINQHYLS